MNPKIPIPFRITQLTSITDEMVMESPEIETILPQFLKFVGDAVLVAHNASFDVSFIEENCRRQGIEPDFTSVDTVGLARVLLPTLSKFKLNVVAKALNISLENHHRAVDDAACTAEIFTKICGNAAGTRHRNYGKSGTDGKLYGGEYPKAAKLPCHYAGAERYWSSKSVSSGIGFPYQIL